MDTELEYGSYVPKPRPRHNGYYAGDFSQTAPMPWEQLRRVMELGHPSGDARRGDQTARSHSGHRWARA